MGVHQFEISLAPRSYFKATLPKIISEDEFEAQQESKTGWWAESQPSESFLTRLRGLLPANKSWGEVEEFVTLGEWGSDLRIWKTEGCVWDITFRFSPGSESWDLMKRFLAIAREERCVLRGRRTGELLEPEEAVVRDRLVNSRAARFLKNPSDAIIEAAEELKARDGEQ